MFAKGRGGWLLRDSAALGLRLAVLFPNVHRYDNWGGGANLAPHPECVSFSLGERRDALGGEPARDKDLDVRVPGEVEAGADLRDEVGRDAASLPRRVQPDCGEIRLQGLGDA